MLEDIFECYKKYGKYCVGGGGWRGKESENNDVTKFEYTI
jgi:hypothetical protein